MPSFAFVLLLLIVVSGLLYFINYILKRVLRLEYNLGFAAPIIPGNANYISSLSIMDNQSNIAHIRKANKKNYIQEKQAEGMVLLSQGKIVFANKAFFKLTGYEPADVFGLDFSQLLKSESLYYYFELIRSNGKLNAEKELLLITKKDIMVTACFKAQNNSDFNSVGLFVIKESLEKPAVQSELNYLMMLENQEILLCQWDDSGVIFINAKARSYLDLPLSYAITKPWLLYSIAGRTDRIALKNCIAEFLATGIFSPCVFMLNAKHSNKYFRLNISCVPGTSHGKPIYQILAFDISAEINKVKRAEELKMKAEIANYNKTAFLANMSHEIRSPLNGIIGFSELLADQEIDEFERERYISIIHSNGNALTSLLTDLIDISKLETGNLEIISKPFRLQVLIAELETQFTRTLAFKSDHTVVTFDNCRILNTVTITSDVNRLRQILINLLTNAIKFTPNGKVEIGADIHDNKVLFWVKDNGIGIPYNKQIAIFDRFKQVGKPGQEHIGGFGLGLTISKALVSLLGGNLWVESEPEKGSIFHFTIKSNTINNTAMETTTNNNIYPFDFSGRTILIAEDIDFSFLYIEAVLRRTNIKILWAQNGRDALELVHTNSDISLVLMDIHMPIMNGYDAAKAIKAYRPDLPVIAQTAFVLPEDIKKCYASGCSGYLAKPIRKEHLLNTLADYFEKLDKEANPYAATSKVSAAQ